MSGISNRLKGIAENIQKKLIADLGQASAIEHPGTKGDNTEKVWIDLLRKYLPTRFRVDSAIIIDSDGKTSQQIDCVIFDSQYTPQIIPNKASLYIPVEAVHAVFEVKQAIDATSLKYASEKVQSVRKLKRTSSSYIGGGCRQEKKRPFHILGGLLALSCGYSENLESSALHSNLNQFDDIARLDFLFSAEDGYADCVKSKHLLGTDKEDQVRNNGDPFIVEDQTGISYGLIRLLEELSWQGTVQAVEWPRYLSNIANPRTIGLPK